MVNEINTVDELMDRIHNDDPANLTADDIDQLIAYHRKNREGGLKPKKDVAKDAPKEALKELLKLSAAQSNVKTFRRI